MRVIVTGGRKYQNAHRIRERLAQLPEDTTIVHGAATGTDHWAKRAALYLKFQTEPHPARWRDPCTDDCKPGHRRYNADGSTYCPGAGHRRNQEMADLGADLCIAFPGNRGTADMVDRARSAGIPVEVLT